VDRSPADAIECVPDHRPCSLGWPADDLGEGVPVDQRLDEPIADDVASARRQTPPRVLVGLSEVSGEGPDVVAVEVRQQARAQLPAAAVARGWPSSAR
jgi:hypothetical protein